MSDKVFIITVREYDEAYENLEDFRTEIETAIGQGQGFPFEIIDVCEVPEAVAHVLERFSATSGAGEEGSSPPGSPGPASSSEEM